MNHNFNRKFRKIPLTIPHEFSGNLILLLHQPQAQRRPIPHLIIRIIQTPPQQDTHTPLNLRIRLSNSKLAERRNRRSPHNRILQHDAVVDVADILGRLDGFGSFHAQQVQNADRELRKLAILDELAQMRERFLPRFRDELDQVEHGFHDGPLELVATFVAQDAGEEGKHARLFGREFEAEGANGLHDGDLEFVSDLAHEGGDGLEKSVDGAFVAGLEKGGDGEGGDGAVGVGDEGLNVRVALPDGVGFEGRELVEDPDGGELGHGTWGGEEEL